VTDYEHGDAFAFCNLHKNPCTVTDLRDAPRRRIDLGGKDGLDRVQNHEIRLQLIDHLHDLLQHDFGIDEYAVRIKLEPVRPHLELEGRLFAAHIEDLHM
jgi:hypothetical protein